MRSSELNPRIKVTKFVKGTAKYLERLKPHISLELTIQRNLIIDMEEKPYCTSISMV